MNVGYIAVIVCLVLTTAGRKDVLYDIGKTHCPCTRFCSDDIKTVNTNGTEELIKTRSSPDDDNFDVCTTTDIYQPKETVSESRAQTVLCCGNCSCEDDCWKTSSCCPDKNNIREEPALTCRSPVVNSIRHARPSNLGYHVIDAYPLSEINDTLVSKCTTDSINDLVDLIWVFDEHQELTFKNEYCALCHHVTHYVKWQLRVKCESLSSTAVLSPLFMLDDQCELKLENPENTTATSFPVCMVVAGYNHYDHCNQTGLWATNDADIERSCDIYHSPYFVESLIHVAGVPVTEKYIKAYKNVFCFSCNTDETLVANPVCVLTQDFGLPEVNCLNSLVTNELSQHYHLYESIFIFMGFRCDFSFLFHFFNENHDSKQNSPKWDVAFCGVTSGDIC